MAEFGQSGGIDPPRTEREDDRAHPHQDVGDPPRERETIAMNVARVVAIWSAVSIPAALAVAAVIRSMGGGGDLGQEIETYLHRHEARSRALAVRSLRVGIVTVVFGAAVVGSLHLAGDIPERIVAAGIRTTKLLQPSRPTTDAAPAVATGSQGRGGAGATSATIAGPPAPGQPSTTVTTQPQDTNDGADRSVGDGEVNGDPATADTAERDVSDTGDEGSPTSGPAPDVGSFAAPGTTTSTSAPASTTSTSTTQPPETTGTTQPSETTTTTQPSETTTTTQPPETTTTTAPPTTTTTTPPSETTALRPGDRGWRP
jgi:hypothetical protein